jgi:cytochrome bd-type quinol oxidase subunit 2
MLTQHRNLLLRVVVYSFFLAALILVILVDANSVEGKFVEDSMTEHVQGIIFFSLALGMLIISTRVQQVSMLASMFAGFFILAFIREQDALLEHNIGTGAWQALVTLVLLAMIYRARSGWVRLKSEFVSHLETCSFGLFIGGFLTTFIFSRLIGMEELWMAILEGDYQRSVKNAVEESFELLGDSLLLFSGVEFYFRYARAKAEQKLYQLEPAHPFAGNYRLANSGNVLKSGNLTEAPRH